MAAATGGGGGRIDFSGSPPLSLRDQNPAIGSSNFNFKRYDSGKFKPRSSIGVAVSKNGWFEEKQEDRQVEAEERRLRLVEWFQQSTEMMRTDGGGPPRWLSPLECASQAEKSPLLFYLPGIDGLGNGLGLHHKRLGEMFNIWSLHIPPADRTPFQDQVKLVERAMKLENSRSPNTPIYLVGESLGACLALSVAARNPDLDLMLILANPATSFDESQIRHLIPLIGFMPEKLDPTLIFMLSCITDVEASVVTCLPLLHGIIPTLSSQVVTLGTPLKMVMATMNKRLPLQQTVGELSETAEAISSYLSVIADVFPRETLVWKLKLLRSASVYANSHLDAVKAQTLILSSGRDWFLPNQKEGKRLRRALTNCEIRSFSKIGHALFLEEGIDLVTIIKGSSFYRRTKRLDYVSDYIPTSSSEFRKAVDSYRWIEVATAPAMLSTLKDGKIVKGLGGIPCEGPVLYVGNHMLLGLEVHPLVVRFMTEKNILVRGLAHPMLFKNMKDTTFFDVSSFDNYRLLGAVPVSAANFYRLFSSKSHILLYPGGVREALHRKGEEYRLFWPEKSEFVRMAVSFGATIVPFGVAGEDDILQLLLDYDDLMKIPYFKEAITNITAGAERLRIDVEGEVGKQDVHHPVIAPKIPGRFYFLFGKPIETRGRKEDLRDKAKAQELYMEVKAEVEKCIGFLKEKREHDPYRSIISRLFFHIRHGFDSEPPTFQL